MTGGVMTKCLLAALLLGGGVLWAEDFSQWRGKGTVAEVRGEVFHFKDDDPGKSNGIFGRHIRITPAPVERQLIFEAEIRRLAGFSGIGIHIAASNLHAKEQEQAAGEAEWKKISLRVPLPAHCDRAYLKLLCAHGYGRTGEAEFRNLSWRVVPLEKKVEKGARFLIYDDDFSGHWDLRGVSCRQTGNSAYSGQRGLEITPAAGQHVSMRLRSLENFVPVVNRALDLSDYVKADGWLEYCIRPRLLFTVGGVSPEKQMVKSCENGWTQVRIPLAELSKRNNLKAFSDLNMTFDGKVDKFSIDRIFFRCNDPSAQVRYVWSGNWKAKLESEMAAWKQLPPDCGNRPKIEQGTFWMNGNPTFLLGVNYFIASNEFDEIWWKRCKILLPDYHYQLLDRKICERFGFNTVQFPGLPFHFVFARNQLPVWDVERDDQRRRNCSNFDRMPISVDPTVIYYFHRNEKAVLNDPVTPQPREILHQNPGWHAFVPFCPEHPMGKKIILGQLRDMSLFTRANHGNPFLYELINESTYDCRCRFNRERFIEFLKKNFGTVAEMNRRLGTGFRDFRSAAFLPDFSKAPALRAAWRSFLSDRFVQVLAEMKKAIADVDSRPDIHFCQQILIAGLLTGSGSTMDQRKTMDVLDVLAIEGGYSYGFAENDGRWESDEMEAVLTRGVHFFSLVADYAAAVVRGKPGKTVADQEHYCMRYDGKDRIPSLPADFPTSLWASVFHGVSASSIFNWSGGKWQWSDMEGARKFARSMKYRGAALLNPYCYPEKTLSGLRGFMEELEPLRNVVLPMPRLKRPEAAILFSITSQRMLGDRQSLPNMENWYNALLREQLPAEFVFEEEFSAENLKPYKILFIPDLKHSLPGTLNVLEEFVQRGGSIVCSEDALSMDPYGLPLENRSFFQQKNVRRCPKGLIGSRLRNLFAEAFLRAGAKIHLELRTAEGKKFRAAEAQLIDRGDTKLILLVNWRNEKAVPARLAITDIAAGRWRVTDPVSRCRVGEFDAEELRRGISFTFFPQERQLFLLETGKADLFPDAAEKNPESIAARAREINAKIEQREQLQGEQKRRAAEAAHRASHWEKTPGAHFQTVNLAGAANMGYVDEVAGDHRGGWFDDGPEAGLPGMKPGRHEYSGIPFEILGGSRAVCVLKGERKPYFPRETPAIPLSGKARRIYFLQACGWSVEDRPLLICELTYADGTRSKLSMAGGRDIGDWHGLKSLPNARIGAAFWTSGKERVGFYCTRRENPYPDKELTSMKFLSTGLAVPLIGAVTLEK